MLELTREQRGEHFGSTRGYLHEWLRDREHDGVSDATVRGGAVLVLCEGEGGSERVQERLPLHALRVKEVALQADACCHLHVTVLAHQESCQYVSQSAVH